MEVPKVEVWTDLIGVGGPATIHGVGIECLKYEIYQWRLIRRPSDIIVYRFVACGPQVLIPPPYTEDDIDNNFALQWYAYPTDTIIVPEGETVVLQADELRSAVVLTNRNQYVYSRIPDSSN